MKCIEQICDKKKISVTPYGGVWIEMRSTTRPLFMTMSRLMEACGLKSTMETEKYGKRRHALWRRVD